MTRPMTLRRARVVERVAPILRQLYAVAGPSPELAGYIRRHRLDVSTISAHAGLITVALCKHFGSNSGERRFTFDPEGIPSVVVEALEADGHSVMDLVSWPLFQPHQFATAIGECDCLNPWGMLNRGGRSLKVWRTPLDWLRSGCDGCVPIARSWAGYWLDRAGGPFIAEDVEHGIELRQLLGEQAKRHRILVPQVEGRAA